MNGSLSLDLHLWRGIGPDVEPDLFLWRWRLGFLTLSVCRVCLLTRIRMFRNAAAQSIATLDQRVRERDGQ